MTQVIFRKWNCDDSVVAVFPQVYHNEELYGRHIVTTYEHVGQHGSAAFSLAMTHSKPAQPQEYADLLSELRSRGYDDLQIRKRR